MATVGSIEYKVVAGTVAAIATFNTNVETEINNGYAPLGQPVTDGTDIFQTMFKGSAASFVSEYEIVSLGTTLTSGFQLITADADVNAADDAITTVGTYYFKVAVNGGPITEYNVVVGATRTYTQIASDMDGQVSGDGITVTFDEDTESFVFTSDATGSTSSISVTAGTTGTDIFVQIATDDATITGFSYGTPVQGTDDNDNAFEIDGNQILNFHPGYKFTVTRSTGNDGVYTVVNSVFNTPNTLITVEETVADETVDGFIEGHSPSVGP